jgi:hypothetical protein
MPDPGSVRSAEGLVPVKLKKLKTKGKVRVVPTFTFTPTGGAASTQSTPLTLRKKLKKK